MKASTRYEVCVVATKDGGIDHTEGAISLRHAQEVINGIRLVSPGVHMIFLRRYQKQNGRETYVVLHKYTVQNGKTADERRAAAMEEVARG